MLIIGNLFLLIRFYKLCSKNRSNSLKLDIEKVELNEIVEESVREFLVNLQILKKM